MMKLLKRFLGVSEPKEQGPIKQQQQLVDSSLRRLQRAIEGEKSSREYLESSHNRLRHAVEETTERLKQQKEGLQ